MRSVKRFIKKAEQQEVERLRNIYKKRKIETSEEKPRIEVP